MFHFSREHSEYDWVHANMTENYLERRVLILLSCAARRRNFRLYNADGGTASTHKINFDRGLGAKRNFGSVIVLLCYCVRKAVTLVTGQVLGGSKVTGYI